MHPAFATIVFGPFATEYHRATVNDSFKEALSEFLESALLPQVEQPFESTCGSIVAEFNDERHCGPKSLVRDRYMLEFTFERPTGNDTIKASIQFDPQSLLFNGLRGRQLYLWTARRAEQHARDTRQIQQLCERIAKQEIAEAKCPLCSGSLQVTDYPDLFDVRCSKRCFNYNYHRDPATGEFLHGHFFFETKP
jgi:hypothetical protein